MSRLHTLPSWLAVIPVALLLFWPLLTGEALFWGLPATQFVPWRAFAFDELAAGRLPLWNPYAGGGAPLLANYQSAFFYPLTWLGVILPAHLAMAVGAILHLVWAGLGMWLFLRALGVPELGRGVSALAFAVTGYTIARFGTPPMAGAVAWMPWLLWSVHRLTERPNGPSARRSVSVMALVVAMLLLVGHAQLAFYALTATSLYALWRAWAARESGRGALLNLARAGGAVALGAGVAAVQLAPTAELLHASQRAGGLDYDFVMNFSYGPLRLLSMVTPHFFGSPADGTYLGKGAYWEDAAYIGFLPLVLALLALFVWLRRRARPDRHPAFAAAPFFALMGAGALALAMGKHTPLYDFLYHNVPTFAMFQAPARWLLLTAFSLSVLAGVGTLGWGRGRWTFFWCRLAATGGAGIVVMALLAPQVIVAHEALSVLSAAMVALGAWITGSAVLTLAQPDPHSQRATVWRRWWQAAVLAFVAIDLLWAWSGFTPTVPASFYDPVTDEQGSARQDSRAYWFADYQDTVMFETWFTFHDFRTAQADWPALRRSRLPDLNVLDHAPQLNNFDPMQPREHLRYIALIESAGPARAEALLRAASVSVVYAETGPPGWAGERERFTAPQPAPRAWLAPAARWFGEQSALEAQLLGPHWDPWETVLISGNPPVAGRARGGRGAVEIVADTHTALHLHAEADGPAWLVLADMWYPGWTATVNGEPVEVMRANLAFRAVPVPAGACEVIFRYDPLSLKIGALVSAANLAVVAVLLAWRGRRRAWRG